VTDQASAPRRFAGPAASVRSQQIAGACIVFALTAFGIVGIAVGIAAIVFFAVGAGAGYSLSGSV